MREHRFIAPDGKESFKEKVNLDDLDDCKKNGMIFFNMYTLDTSKPSLLDSLYEQLEEIPDQEDLNLSIRHMAKLLQEKIEDDADKILKSVRDEIISMIKLKYTPININDRI